MNIPAIFKIARRKILSFRLNVLVQIQGYKKTRLER
jgi:hypothetical protein